MGNLPLIDFIILGLMLLFVTFAGHLLGGRGIKDVAGFFKGDNNVPWWAVSISIIATKISALTFIALPAKVFVDGGNLEYGLAIIGFVIGNVLMAFLFVKPYYQEGVYSPYDFIGSRIHPDVAVLSRLLFLIGTILSQSIRLLATAVVLQVISGLDMVVCIGIIVVFSMLWSVLGGIKTVIWTDVLLFVIFMLGGLTAIYSVFNGVDLTFSEMVRLLDEKAKLKLMNYSLDPRVAYTLWSGLLGAAFFELGSNAIDQVVTQRIMCCRSARQAKLAVVASAMSVVPTIIMLVLGLALVVFFSQKGLSAENAYLIKPGEDQIFPFFVVHYMPTGFSGLILTGMFASGISTLDSALTALSQTTVVGIRKTIQTVDNNHKENDTQNQDGQNKQTIHEKDVRLLRKSRYFVLMWGMVFFFAAILLWGVTKTSGQGLIDIGLLVPGFVYGALLGLALLSLKGGVTKGAAFSGAIAGCAVTLILWQLDVGFFWWYPVAAMVTYTLGVLMRFQNCSSGTII